MPTNSPITKPQDIELNEIETKEQQAVRERDEKDDAAKDILKRYNLHAITDRKQKELTVLILQEIALHKDSGVKVDVINGEVVISIETSMFERFKAPLDMFKANLKEIWNNPREYFKSQNEAFCDGLKMDIDRVIDFIGDFLKNPFVAIGKLIKSMFSADLINLEYLNQEDDKFDNKIKISPTAKSGSENAMDSLIPAVMGKKLYASTPLSEAIKVTYDKYKQENQATALPASSAP